MWSAGKKIKCRMARAREAIDRCICMYIPIVIDELSISENAAVTPDSYTLITEFPGYAKTVFHTAKNFLCNFFFRSHSPRLYISNLYSI